MEPELRPTGICAVGDIPWGTHFCHFYETESDLLDILIPFFKTGLENREFCLWIVFDPLSESEAIDALRRAIPAADEHLAAGDMEIVSHKDWYLRDGRFNVQAAVDKAVNKLNEATAKGYAGLRANGIEAWLTHEFRDDFAEYERRLDKLLQDHHILVICTYPLASSSTPEIFDLLESHQFAIARRRGEWITIDGPEYVEAKNEIKRLNADLEARVILRTEELAVANRELHAEIAEREKAERELRHLHQRYSLILNSVGEGIHGIDRTGTIKFENPMASQLLGWTPGGLVGKNSHETLHHSRADGSPYPEDECPIVGAMSDGKIHRVDNEVFWRKDGSSFPVEYVSSPLDSEGEGIIGTVVVFQDITARRQAEKALQRAYDDLEIRVAERTVELLAAKEDADKANRAKSEFLSRMSHELRTPLNAILGFGQILALEDLGENENESVHFILKAGRHLLSLINEVLDIARIEADRLALEPEPIHVHFLVREVLDLVRPLALNKRVRLVNMTEESCSERDWYLVADETRLKQVLLNLVSNAVKYNRDGGEVMVSCEEVVREAPVWPGPSDTPVPSEGPAGSLVPQSPSHFVRLNVRDTGQGLTPEDLARLFVPFERLAAERSGIEGTGIGLALSKRLAEAMRGRIGVESVPGEGSVFWVEFPRAVTELLEVEETEVESEPTRAPVPAEHGPARSVLYIEDNLANRSLVEHILDRLPAMELHFAENAAQGLAMAREHRPHLILLDLHLPDMMGDTVLHHLKSDPDTSATPIVIISSDTGTSQTERLMTAGATDFLAKPLNVVSFLRVVEGLIPAPGKG